MFELFEPILGSKLLDEKFFCVTVCILVFCMVYLCRFRVGLGWGFRGFMGSNGVVCLFAGEKPKAKRYI